jgi:hypothetical protein
MQCQNQVSTPLGPFALRKENSPLWNSLSFAMMRSFGFSIQDYSPFSMQFDQVVDDLQKVVISYLPWTFPFDGIKGSHKDDNEAVETTMDAKEAGGSSNRIIIGSGTCCLGRAKRRQHHGTSFSLILRLHVIDSSVPTNSNQNTLQKIHNLTGFRWLDLKMAFSTRMGFSA